MKRSTRQLGAEFGQLTEIIEFLMALPIVAEIDKPMAEIYDIAYAQYLALRLSCQDWRTQFDKNQSTAEQLTSLLNAIESMVAKLEVFKNELLARPELAPDKRIYLKHFEAFKTAIDTFSKNIGVALGENDQTVDNMTYPIQTFVGNQFDIEDRIIDDLGLHYGVKVLDACKLVMQSLGSSPSQLNQYLLQLCKFVGVLVPLEMREKMPAAAICKQVFFLPEDDLKQQPHNLYTKQQESRFLEVASDRFALQKSLARAVMGHMPKMR